MGRKSRLRVERLPEKLRQIREIAGLSQSQMVERLGAADHIDRSKVSAYESGEREPPLLILLRYSRVGGLSVEYLIDDALDLPANFSMLSIE